MKNIVLIGPPFAGKGTQCELISKKFNFTHLSTGAAIRGEIKKNSEFGIKAKEYSAKGLLAPDDLLEQIVRNFIKDNMNPQGFLFDGYPRNLPQVKTLIKILTELDNKIDSFVILEVPNEELLKRAIKRAEIENREDDKDPEVIQRRLDIYESETKPIIDYAESNGFTVHKINGMGTIEEIFAKISEKIN